MNRNARPCARHVGILTGAFAAAMSVLVAQSPPTSREAWQRSDDIVAALALTAGSRVADVGAGDGFFTLRLARAVGPEGLVLAVDIDPKMLELLKQLAEAVTHACSFRRPMKIPLSLAAADIAGNDAG
jgi:predicted methyltransferase